MKMNMQNHLENAFVQYAVAANSFEYCSALWASLTKHLASQLQLTECMPSHHQIIMVNNSLILKRRSFEQVDSL